MKFKTVITVLLAAGGLYFCAPAAADDSDAQSNVTRQLNVYKDSLYSSSDEQIRIQAAIELLLCQDRQAKQVLLEAISQDVNIFAQSAVCKALVQPDVLNVKTRNEFLNPLFQILFYGKDSQSLIAAEALVGYDYKVIGDRLQKAIKDESLPISARLNAVYALKIRAEKEDIFELIDLLGYKDLRISGKAELALQDILGLPVGTDISEWAQVRKELEKQSAVEVSKARLRREMAKAHQLEAKVGIWETRYIGAIDSLYDLINDDTTRSSFLMQKLTDDQRAVQIWAIGKVSEWRLSEKTLPDSFGPILISLVSSNEDAVRRATANLLALTGYFDPAEKLLAQLEVEKNEIIKLDLFVALGEAVSYATVSKTITLSPRIYLATLDWAGRFLLDSDPAKAQKASQVICKLLTNDWFTNEDLTKYVAMLAQRYSQEKPGIHDALRGEMLAGMAGLCGEKNNRAECAKAFEALFMAALSDGSEIVRESAVTGLINIDEPKAREILISKSLFDDPSITIRQNIFALTGRVGSDADLSWLSGKLAKADSEQAWTAMLEIFKRSSSSTLADWISNIEADPNVVIAMERKITLLEMGEQKAQSENQPAVLNAIRKRLAVAYSQAGQSTKALEYWGKVSESPLEADRLNAFSAIFDEQLRQNKFDAIARMVENRLIDTDMDANDAIVVKIDSRLSSGPGENNAALLAALKAVKTISARKAWLEQIDRWKAKVGDPNTAANPEKIKP